MDKAMALETLTFLQNSAEICGSVAAKIKEAALRLREDGLSSDADTASQQVQQITMLLGVLSSMADCTSSYKSSLELSLKV